MRLPTLLALLAYAALLRPACSGRGTLVAHAAGAPHLAAVPDWRSALQPRSASSDNAPPDALQRFMRAVAARRAQGERDAAVPAAAAPATAAPAVPHSPPPPPAAEEPGWRGDVSGSPPLLGAAGAASLPPPPLAAATGEAVHAAQSAESDEDGIGSNATQAGGHEGDADGPTPAQDAALAEALAAHAEAAAAYAEQRCPGCAAGGGNCDAERCACDCPIGRAGPTCANATLSACELFAGYVTPCGGHLTSCACLEACAAQLRVGLEWFNGETCLEAPPPRAADGAPLPADVAVLDAYMGGLQRRVAHTGDPFPAAPSGDCGETGCGARGVCRGAGRGCACLPGRAGPGCARKTATPPCLNDCSGRGACSQDGAAWCACQPGFWGDDCALSRQADDSTTRLWSRLPHDANASTNTLLLPAPALPAVFVYHLPPHCSAYWAPYGIDRPASEMLHEHLAASAHRVADGSAASLFFVPIPMRKLQRAAVGGATALSCVAELASSFPHYNATRRGRNHLLVTPSDAGPAEAWRDSWAREGLPEAVAAFSLLTHHGAVAGAASPAGGDRALFRRGVDVLLPPLQSRATGWDAVTSPLFGAAAPERNITLFWAGAVSRLPGHAERNMRAAVYDTFRDAPGMVLIDTSSTPPAEPGEYGALFARAKFCLAPAGKGGGWGRRATLAALHGCVPVLLQDATEDALGELVDWAAFSLRLDEDDVASLPAVLAAVTPRRLRSMQRQLACAAPRWLWSSVLGAAGGEDGSEDAVASTLQVLARRALRANGTAGAMPAAPCALQRARKHAGCVGAPLMAERDERSGGAARPQPAWWPAGGAACAGTLPPCALPHGAPPQCANDGDAAAGFLIVPQEPDGDGEDTTDTTGGDEDDDE